MTLRDTPRDLAYTAAKCLVAFIALVFLLYCSEFLWFILTTDDEHVTLENLLLIVPVGFLFYVEVSTVLSAFGISMLAWMIAFVGIFFANGALRMAAVVFGFATCVAASGLFGQYWFAALPSVFALGYLTLWAWSLRNHIVLADGDPSRAAELMQQRHALQVREVSQENVISRR